MAGTIYFGTRGYMRYIPAPSIDADTSKVGYSSTMAYLNGGAGVRNSKGAAKAYVFSWNLAPSASLRPITDYADGLYDSIDGTNLTYFIDPKLLGPKGNVLSQLWAAPAQARPDGMSLIPNQNPGVATTPANVLSYPARSAVYTLNGSSSTIWIPLEPGKVAWFGVHGTASSAACMTATPTQGYSTLTPVDLTMMTVTDTNRVNASFDSADCDGILLGFTNLGPTSIETALVAGVIVQILDAGATPEQGDFISGQGHSGCEFVGKPVESEHSAALDLVGMSAKLLETGSWL